MTSEIICDLCGNEVGNRRFCVTEAVEDISLRSLCATCYDNYAKRLEEAQADCDKACADAHGNYYATVEALKAEARKQ